MDALAELRRFAHRRDYAALKRRLADSCLEEVAEAWIGLSPIEKILAFRLLGAKRAMEFFTGLDFHQKYFLLTAFDLNSLAPVIEDLPERTQLLFEPLTSAHYDRMLHLTIQGRIDITITGPSN